VFSKFINVNFVPVSNKKSVLLNITSPEMTIRKTKKKVEKQASLQLLDWVEEMNQAIDNLSENRTRFFFFFFFFLFLALLFFKLIFVI
jgi:hypothetical protein